MKKMIKKAKGLRVESLKIRLLCQYQYFYNLTARNLF
ncbi:MAG: hypothetical protein BWX49_00240 [Bacteroidetes bacterium ADurb.Bin008]|nr:MAG: hypothetical protein BWX49_00240 [Bacteroidetes bacterium ADurb.Bin008]